MGKIFKADEYKGVIKINGQYPDNTGNFDLTRMIEEEVAKAMAAYNLKATTAAVVKKP